MNVRAEYKVANASDFEWSGVYGYLPPEPKVYEKLGELLLTMRMKTEKDIVDLEKVAKLVIDELQTTYYSEPESDDTVLERLEDSSWRLKSVLDTVLSREPELMESGLDMELAAVVIIGKYLYCLVIGESKILILRDGEFANISDALIDRDRSGLFRSGSLEIENADKLLLFTEKTISVTDPKLYKLASNLDLSLFDKIGGTPGSAMLLAAEDTIQWKEKEEVVGETVPSGELSESETSEKTYETLEDSFETTHESSETDNEKIEEIVSNEHSYDDYSDSDEEYEETSNILEYAKDVSGRGVLKGKEVGTQVIQKSKVVISSLLSKVSTMRNGDTGEFAEGDSETYEPLEIQNMSSDRNVRRNHHTNSEKTYITVLKNIAATSKQVIEALMQFLREQLMGSNDRRQRNSSKIKRNRYIFVGVLLLFVLVVVYGIRSFNVRTANRQLELEFVETAESYKEQKDTFAASVTTSTISSLTERQSKLATAQELEAGISNFIKENTDTETELTADMSAALADLQSSLSDLNALTNTLNLDKPFSQPQVVADIGLIFAGSETVDLEYSAGNLFVSDSARNTVYKLGLSLNSQVEEFVTDLSKPKTLVRNASDEIIIYDENTTSSIGIFSPEDASSFRRFPGLPVSEIANVGEVGLFDANNALYEINLSHGQIFKRIQVGADYASGGNLLDTLASSNWKTDPLLKKAIDIEVPFGIYALIDGTGLQRYVGGGDNNLGNDMFTNTLAADISALANATALDANDQYVALGDSLNQRVLLFKHSDLENIGESPLEFVQQYSYTGSEQIFTDIKEIVIVGSEMYVLDNARIIRLEITR